MSKLCIVPCGSRKIWEKNSKAGPTQAKAVYIGSYAKKCIEYAEKFYSGHYRILSAKYGLMRPDFIISQDYNVTFNNPSGHVVSMERLAEQVYEEGLKKKYKEVVVLGGREYVSRISIAFNGCVIHTPLATCKGMGYMMQKINKSILRGLPLA